jgi:hypothetical protein
MLLELELPRVLAPDLSSNCYSRACLQQTHLNCPPNGQASICPLTPSCIAQGERCAPAAFLRSMSNLSGPLSRIEPLSSVPVVTIACPLRCHLVDRSEAQSKSRSGKATPTRREAPSVFGAVQACVHSQHPSCMITHLPAFQLPGWQGGTFSY